MSASGSVTIWLQCLRDTADAAATVEIWRQFATRVLRLARAKLRNRGIRIADEDDVTNTVFEALFTGVVNGDFPNLNNRDDLWALLIHLTERKTIDIIRYDGRKKRTASTNHHSDQPLELGPDGLANVGDLSDGQPTPDAEVQFAEDCALLMAKLNDATLCAIVQLKLAGHTNAEIARLLSRPLRTIERKVALIRSIWSQADGEEEDASSQTGSTAG